MSRSALRYVLFHFVQTFYECNWYGCPDIVIDYMLSKNNKAEQLLDYLCDETSYGIMKPNERKKSGASMFSQVGGSGVGGQSIMKAFGGTARVSKQLRTTLMNVRR